MSTDLFFSKLTSLTLPTNLAAGDSNVLPLKEIGYDAEAFTIVAPAAISDGGTITIMGSVDDGTTYATLCDSTGTAIVLPGAGKAITYNGIFTALSHIKLHASAAVATTLIFQIAKASRA